ncbi:MAG: ATP-dependent DNA helicase RecG [Nitrospirales bacterium]|nr:ATP-dependent DNA helicase RecG [Nitrospirales bacterium]
MDLTSPIQYVKGVGPQRARLLLRLGIETVKDLLYYLPARYEDRASIKRIAQLSPGNHTVLAKVVRSDLVSASPRNPKLKIFQLLLSDGSAFLTAKWFNQAFLKKVFSQGQEVVLYGQVKPGFRGAGLEMMNPEFEIAEEGDSSASASIHTGRIVPIYRATEGVSQRQIRGMVYTLLQSFPSIPDPFPEDLIGAHNFPELRESLIRVHFPPKETSLDDLNRGTSRFHQRLAYDELFAMEAGLASLKQGETRERGISFTPDGRFVLQLRERLPFRLTGAQERVFREILGDMKAAFPMNRLVQGDVGSGKTVVALLAMLSAVESGYQAAMMAPTEILAEQHFITIHRLVEELGLKVALLTGTKKERAAAGEADIVIGTHALIQEAVSFRNLGLVVIDEQHRFGVMQRATLRKKGLNPDTLVMTATPIPRTLALTLYGDLDYSVIDELPPRRSPIKTRLIYEANKREIYRLIREETAKGRQVYVVYPLIEESEAMNLKAAVTGMEALQGMFPELRVGLLHGKMKTAEREGVMRDFKEGQIQLLVSTTVIEVGVDVPNATLMVIIHAERFGLAQLHQLRGRVGRGADQSFCILLSYNSHGDAGRRLEVMVETTDGFRIAEEDLEIRGPGEFFGTRQSGLPDLKAANLVRDAGLVELARRDAFSLVEKDPELQSHPDLRSFVEGFWGKRLELFKTA